jgi:hypothetical protein
MAEKVALEEERLKEIKLEIEKLEDINLHLRVADYKSSYP